MFAFKCISRFSIRRYVEEQTKKENPICNSLRRASNFQRPRLSPMHHDQMRTLKSDFLKNCNDMTAEKWHNIRESLMSNYKQINRNNIDATILGLCNEPEYIQLAKEYVTYLEDNSIKPNTATLGRLLRVYNTAYQHNGGLTNKEEEEVIAICDQIQAQHDILDAITCEHLIHGLVATQSRWKDALSVLKMLKLTAMPGISVYTQLILKAFSLQELDLGWSLLEEMVQQGKLPKCEVYMEFINVIYKDNSTFQVHFQKFLNFLAKYQLVLTQKVADHIEELLKHKNFKLHARTIQISRFGKCENCKKHMESVAISEKDFEKLRDSFLEMVLIRKDVFQKSTPEEISNFKRFVDETGPYDCVIDGLNVAFSKGSKKAPKDLANLLVAVVRYFENQQKSVLVLGRKHMNNWPKISMKYLREHAHVYLTNNLTHDDPFMLYATLKSGQSTDFFSRDLMRSHAHLLGQELKPVFRRWQQEHQFSLVTQTNSGKVIIKEPVRHLICAHKVNNTWHLPLTPVYTSHMPETFELPESWLCIATET